MPFTDVWNPAYEAIPADTENISLGANRIRDLKENIRERANIDHSWGDTADNGQHNQITFNVSLADPATVAATGYLYTKSVAGATELFWKDAAGNVLQITTGGAIDFKSFPSGTVMPFLQAAPPTGWAVNSSFNDQMIRLTNSTGGGTGGSWTIGGTSLALTRGSMSAGTTTVDGGSTVTIAGHVLAVGEIPSHTHNVIVPVTGGVSANGGGGTNVADFGNTGYNTDGGTGGGGSHGHPGSTLSLVLSSSTTLAGVPSGTFSNDASWRPAYANACVGTKS